MHCKLNAALGQTLPLAGWEAGYGSLLIDSTNRLRMYVRTTTTASIGNVRRSHPIPNLAPGQWLWIWAVVDIGNAECRYHYCHGYHLSAWNFSAAVGTFAGGPLIATGTNIVTRRRSGNHSVRPNQLGLLR